MLDVSIVDRNNTLSLLLVKEFGLHTDILLGRS